jgi:hypothetical protein
LIFSNNFFILLITNFKKKAKEEQEFREMMANWVVGVDGEAVEQSFAGIAYWHVENSNSRDCARERWRLRKRHKDRLKAARVLPQPFKYLIQSALSMVTPIALRTKFKEELPHDIHDERADDLVDVFWDWQVSFLLSFFFQFVFHLFTYFL